jgi:hypothetical protein
MWYFITVYISEDEIKYVAEIRNSERRKYRGLNTVGTQLTVCVNTPLEHDTNPVIYFLATLNELFEHELQYVRGGDMVSVANYNEVDQKVRPIGISFRRRDQFSGEAIWSVLEEVAQ